MKSRTAGPVSAASMASNPDSASAANLLDVASVSDLARAPGGHACSPRGPSVAAQRAARQTEALLASPTASGGLLPSSYATESRAAPESYAPGGEVVSPRAPS